MITKIQSSDKRTFSNGHQIVSLLVGQPLDEIRGSGRWRKRLFKSSGSENETIQIYNFILKPSFYIRSMCGPYIKGPYIELKGTLQITYLF